MNIVWNRHSPKLYRFVVIKGTRGYAKYRNKPTKWFWYCTRTGRRAWITPYIGTTDWHRFKELGYPVAGGGA